MVHTPARLKLMHARGQCYFSRVFTLLSVDAVNSAETPKALARTLWDPTHANRTVPVFRQKLAIENAVGSHTCSLEACAACNHCHSSRASSTSYHCHRKLHHNTKGSSIIEEYYSAFGEGGAGMKDYFTFWQGFTQRVYTDPAVLARIAAYGARFLYVFCCARVT